MRRTIIVINIRTNSEAKPEHYIQDRSFAGVGTQSGTFWSYSKVKISHYVVRKFPKSAYSLTLHGYQSLRILMLQIYSIGYTLHPRDIVTFLYYSDILKMF